MTNRHDARDWGSDSSSDSSGIGSFKEFVASPRPSYDVSFGKWLRAIERESWTY